MQAALISPIPLFPKTLTLTLTSSLSVPSKRSNFSPSPLVEFSPKTPSYGEFHWCIPFFIKDFVLISRYGTVEIWRVVFSAENLGFCMGFFCVLCSIQWNWKRGLKQCNWWWVLVVNFFFLLASVLFHCYDFIVKRMFNDQWRVPWFRFGFFLLEIFVLFFCSVWIFSVKIQWIGG